ncbi:hypothetical protein GCM10025868_29170 [Angustibacter aerolatus]|uniref:Response regulatory domain-containing protein n=1 Tax=Angustibacter aerolatus TaxID=1162965 RepID=A0ABQ6JIU0_9ACTN|nr:hypothetical protein GCM10025868_29170 [Angustibacter aerolatus]
MRAGLAALLDSTDDLTVVGQAADGEQAVEQAAALRPDVVLMDLSMPVVDGVEATRRLVAARPGVRVVVLTSFSDHDKVTEALRAGAIGYLLKDCEPAEPAGRGAVGGEGARAARPAGRPRAAARRRAPPDRRA